MPAAAVVAKVLTATPRGIEALPVTVEVDTRGGQDKFYLVGLPDKAVQESVERVRAAILNSDMKFPPMTVVCNLAPGDIKKEGPIMDLPIAIAILAKHGQIPLGALEDTMIAGELGLDGDIRPIDGAINMALLCHRIGLKRLLLPEGNAAEAAIFPNVEVYPMRSLRDTVEMLNGSLAHQPCEVITEDFLADGRYEFDYSDVKGQTQAIRALEIAAAGGHNVLMVGPPGSGKTMLAHRLPTIMPPLSLEESIAVTQIYSASGKRKGHNGLMRERPFRSPHHTASRASIVGGDTQPKPGEVSYAHLGVLFMDEMPEFNAGVLEALRQPLEDGVVTVTRVHSSLDFPAQCILVGAMNPCPCGFKSYPEAKCVGAAACSRYGGRLSGPLLDRIDLHITVPRLKPEELIDKPAGENSKAIRERVMVARDRQAERFGSRRVNGSMSPKQLQATVPLDREASDFMKVAADRMRLSGRAFDRLLKVGRTIADLAGDERVQKRHLAEAVQYRQMIV